MPPSMTITKNRERMDVSQIDAPLTSSLAAETAERLTVPAGGSDDAPPAPGQPIASIAITKP